MNEWITRILIAIIFYLIGFWVNALTGYKIKLVKRK
jgi:hypothetical protein